MVIPVAMSDVMSALAPEVTPVVMSDVISALAPEVLEAFVSSVMVSVAATISTLTFMTGTSSSIDGGSSS